MNEKITVVEESRFSFWSFFKFLLLIGLIGAGWYYAKQYQIDIEQYRETFREYPIVISGAIFIGIYVFSTTLVWVGPQDVLRISSALIFGVRTSAILVSIAELINAAILFTLCRWLGQDFVEKTFKWDKRKSYYEPHSEASLMEIIALRINPLIPFRLMDVGFGLSTVGFFKYFLAILLATPCRVYWLQMIIAGVGENIFDPTAIYKYFTDNPPVVFYSGIYFVAVVVLSIVALIVRSARHRRERLRII